MTRNIIKKAGVVIGIIVVFAGAIAGYCDTKFTANETEKDLTKLEEKVDKSLDKLEKKVDSLVKEQGDIKVQNAAIYEIVKFLKEKSE